MPRERLKEIVSYMQRFEFEAGQVVMAQGDKGDFFYVLESGVYEVCATCMRPNHAATPCCPNVTPPCVAPLSHASSCGLMWSRRVARICDATLRGASFACICRCT